MSYKLVGYYDSIGDNDFVFVDPIFRFSTSDILYRAVNKNDVIEHFTTFPCGLVGIINGGLYKIGDPSIYMYIYRGVLYQGTRIQISPELKKLYNASDAEFSPLSKYDVGFFFRDDNMAREPLKRFIKSDQNTARVTLENFLMPSMLKT